MSTFGLESLVCGLQSYFRPRWSPCPTTALASLNDYNDRDDDTIVCYGGGDGDNASHKCDDANDDYK